MSRLSFRHTLLASFLLIAAILGSAALRGLIALEDFAARSREANEIALRATGAVQQLAERTVDLERSARQFLVVEDPILLGNFEQAREESLSALERIEGLGLPHVRGLIEGWRWAAASAAIALAERPGTEAAVADALARLAPINEQLATAIRVQIGRERLQRLAELERVRFTLGWHVVAAFAAALLLTAITGWWVLRPLRAVDRAIESLGESRLDKPVAITGPADLRRLGRRLDWLRLRLADLESNRARVLRHVSHELKTPLASLREGIALLQDRVVGDLTAGQREVVTILEQNARILQERIESLLGYNAAVFDAGRLERRAVNLRRLAEAVLAERALEMQARRITATVTGTVAPIHADPDKLDIVLANLVGNAIAFSPEGGEIRIRLSGDRQHARIDCIDQGPGVPPEEAERIFEPFVQGSHPAPAPRQGSGLGLSIVREFVAAHGGTVRLVESAAGAHFQVELPHDA